MSLSPSRAARAAADITRAQVEKGDGGRSALRTVGFVVWLLLWSMVVAASLGPVAESVPGTDKLHHFLAYGALAGTALLFARSPVGLIAAAIGTVLASGAIEILQGYVPNRQPDVADLAANGVGAAFGLAIALAILLVRRRRSQSA
ncbi:VanZ family protein [Marinivivus vitaminiproducens]|uniref:VanZ family protein n=1 Tax=Marinivivus vitaminiproducens TaxID=3035935 RepID=UPI0027AA16A9|nr:VanZ family protein [Geminicoccaceae bacterium SCSIO 64248]